MRRQGLRQGQTMTELESPESGVIQPKKRAFFCVRSLPENVISCAACLRLCPTECSSFTTIPERAVDFG
jgi:ferredoxin